MDIKEKIMGELILRLYNKNDKNDYKILFPLMKNFLNDYYGKEEISEARVYRTIFAFLSPRKGTNEAYFFENEHHEIIGFCVVLEDRRNNSLIIQHFYICPSLRRNKEHHWGTTAFNSLKLLFNPNYITLEVIDGNENSHEFWNSLGFIEIIEAFSKISGFPCVHKFTLKINVKNGIAKTHSPAVRR